MRSFVRPVALPRGRRDDRLAPARPGGAAPIVAPFPASAVGSVVGRARASTARAADLARVAQIDQRRDRIRRAAGPLTAVASGAGAGARGSSNPSRSRSSSSTRSAVFLPDAGDLLQIARDRLPCTAAAARRRRSRRESPAPAAGRRRRSRSAARRRAAPRAGRSRTAAARPRERGCGRAARPWTCRRLRAARRTCSAGSATS